MPAEQAADLHLRASGLEFSIYRPAISYALLTLPKKWLASLDDGPANGCH